MLQIPFKVQPIAPELVEIGNEQIGILELPKLGDITPNERIFLNEHSGVSTRKLVVKFASSISKEMGKTVSEVYQIAVNYLGSQNSEDLNEHIEAFVNFQEEFESLIEKNNFVKAVAMLRRICPEADLDNSKNVHPALIRELTDFAVKEESGWVEEQASIELTDEELGKSPTLQKKNPTGKKSTGE